jgi:hypothetical protein
MKKELQSKDVLKTISGGRGGGSGLIFPPKRPEGEE